MHGTSDWTDLIGLRRVRRGAEFRGTGMRRLLAVSAAPVAEPRRRLTPRLLPGTVTGGRWQPALLLPALLVGACVGASKAEAQTTVTVDSDTTAFVVVNTTIAGGLISPYGTLDTVNGVTLTNDGGLTNDVGGTLNNNDGGTLTNDGTLANENGATLAIETGGTLLGNVQNDGFLDFESADDVSYAGNISGSGFLAQEGSGTLTLSGANTYTGGTTIEGASTLNITTDAALGTGTVTFDGGTLQAGANDLDIANTMTVNSTGTVDNNGNSVTLSGPITGTGALAFTGTSITTLTGANTYSGGTTIDGGTLAIGTGGSLSATGSVDLAGAGATFDISAASDNQTIGALSGVVGSTVSIGANALTFGAATFAGGFTGTGRLVKQASSLAILDGNSSAFAGTTTIDDGTLEVGDATDPGAVPGGDVTVDTAGTLRGHSTIGGKGSWRRDG